MLERESLGRKAKYQCQVQVLRILAESFHGEVKRVHEFCSKYCLSYVFRQTGP